MSEFRRAKRRKVPDTIEVYDTMTDQVVGRIGNISETGMLMLATVPGMDDALYQLRFSLNSARGKHALEVGAHQLWSDAANSPGQFWTGFRFIDIGRQDAQVLREWIESPGAQYV